MQQKQSLCAIADLGLEGDLHAKRSRARFGIELKTLAPGTRLRVGGAVFEITKSCTPCEFIEDIRPGLRAEMEGQRGMLARVVEGGEMRVGDGIRVESDSQLPSA